jgi:hypothetical protein
MGKDNQPKHRQLGRDLRRRAPVKEASERLLIVCEGSKTEPNYLEEIRKEFRLASTRVRVQPSSFGTGPLQVVQFAEHLFLEGDLNKSILARDFDRVYAVFDRDDHETYHAALSKMASLNRRFRNNEKSKVSFEAIASVPCFELWLLLHFEDIQAPIERTQVYERLRGYLPDYDKGQSGYWAATKPNLSLAIERAKIRQNHSTPHNGLQPYTDMDRLVEKLIGLTQRYST